MRGKAPRGLCPPSPAAAAAASATSSSAATNPMMTTSTSPQQCSTGQPCGSAATGTYSPLGDYRDDDLPWDEDKPSSSANTISGGGSGDDDEHDDENAGVLTMVRVTVRDSVAYGHGGGAAWNGRGGAVAVLNKYARATFTECTFIGNEAWGGEDSDDLFAPGTPGSNPGGAAAAATPAVDYSTNLGEGGGVYVSGAAVRFDRCTFEGQTAEKEGGAVFVDGGATTTFDGCTFRRNGVHDDYWDGGGALYVGGPGTTARLDITRFESNHVMVYPDSRRKALTCGGGAAAVVRGAAVTFTFVLFAGNSAPRGGAVCVHDAAASYNEVVFRSNTARHMWFGKPPGFDVECVQCFAYGGADGAGGGGGEVEGAVGQVTPVVTAIDRCAYRRDADATATFETPEGARPVCAPPPGAFDTPSPIVLVDAPSPVPPPSSSSPFASWARPAGGRAVGTVQSMSSGAGGGGSTEEEEEEDIMVMGSEASY